MAFNIWFIGKDTMDSIIKELQANRDRIDAAISALEGNDGARNGIIDSHKPRWGGSRKGRKMSAAARRRISAGMAKSWKKRKRNK